MKKEKTPLPAPETYSLRDLAALRAACRICAAPEDPFKLFCAGMRFAFTRFPSITTDAGNLSPREILDAMKEITREYAALEPMSDIRKDVCEVYLRVLDNETQGV
jgi:hypothetical protein